MQGIALGALVQGVDVVGREYAGGWWDWLSPFSILTGVAVVVGYALLGATWLNLKLEGRVQARMQRYAMPLALATFGFIGLASLLTPFQDPVYFERWFAWPAMAFSAVVPVLLAGVAWWLYFGLRRGYDLGPFLAALAIFVLCFIGIGISFYPHIVPPSLTIAEAAAPDASLRFALVGALGLLPLILGYTAYTYWVFRGRLDPTKGYH